MEFQRRFVERLRPPPTQGEAAEQPVAPDGASRRR